MGDSPIRLLKVVIPVHYGKLVVKEGEGKAGASRRGNTSSSSDRDDYWV